jgi:hypothetical protein
LTCWHVACSVADVLIFVVARRRLDRYDELCRLFGDARDVRIVLDRREGERREPHPDFSGINRRRSERRHGLGVEPFRKLGWAVIDTDELGSLDSGRE